MLLSVLVLANVFAIVVDVAFVLSNILAVMVQVLLIAMDVAPVRTDVLLIFGNVGFVLANIGALFGYPGLVAFLDLFVEFAAVLGQILFVRPQITAIFADISPVVAQIALV